MCTCTLATSRAAYARSRVWVFCAEAKQAYNSEVPSKQAIARLLMCTRWLMHDDSYSPRKDVVAAIEVMLGKDAQYGCEEYSLQRYKLQPYNGWKAGATLP
eukprot:1151487-Pelagomonas_calceolata.AAC.8